MDIAYIYLCNSCEKLGFEVFTNLSNYHKEKTLGQQLNDKKIYSNFRCMNCNAAKSFLTDVRFIHKKEMVDVYNDLEDQRVKCILNKERIILNA